MKSLHKIEFYKHNLDQRDIEECIQVLNSYFLTTGEVVKNFEKKFAEYLKIEHVVGVSSCTDALYLALKYLGIKTGDEVLTTPMSFIATANAVEYCGAKPVFVDVEETTGNIDAAKIEEAITPSTKAILVVHLYGQMCDMKLIKRIAKKYNLKIIEDAAHCIEGERDGVRVGELGDISCFSFYATKNLACGEGGAIACHTQEAKDWFLRARQHGMSKSAADRYSGRYEHYDMEFLGYKCNLTNIQASLLINQMDRLERLRREKEKIATQYDVGFKENSYIQTPKVLPHSTHARHLFTIWVKPAKRDEYLSLLQDQGIGVAVNFRTIHLMTYYKDKYKYQKGDFPAAENIGNSTITLPFYPKLKINEVEIVISVVNEIVKS